MQTAPYPPLERRSIRFPERRYGQHRFLVQMTLEFLQMWYGSREPGDHKYLDDEQETEILIHDKSSFKLESMGRLPAVVTHRKPVRSTKGSGINRLQSVNMRTGKKVFMDRSAGQVAIHVISEDGMEAEDLAGEIFEFFSSLHDSLRKLGLFSIDVVDIGEERKILVSSEERRTVVTVSLMASWQRVWSTEGGTPTTLATALVDMSMCP